MERYGEKSRRSFRRYIARIMRKKTEQRKNETRRKRNLSKEDRRREVGTAMERINGDSG